MSRSLTIKNETDWDGRDLRTLCRRVIDKIDGRTERTIRIATSRSSGKERMWKFARKDDGCTVGTARRMYRGYAYYPRGSRNVNLHRAVYMGVPKVYRDIDGERLVHEFSPRMFARVLEHELWHTRGLRHGEMTDAVRWCGQDIDYVDDITVRPKPSVREQIEA